MPITDSALRRVYETFADIILNANNRVGINDVMITERLLEQSVLVDRSQLIEDISSAVSLHDPKLGNTVVLNSDKSIKAINLVTESRGNFTNCLAAVFSKHNIITRPGTLPDCKVSIYEDGMITARVGNKPMHIVEHPDFKLERTYVRNMDELKDGQEFYIKATQSFLIKQVAQGAEIKAIYDGLSYDEAYTSQLSPTMNTGIEGVDTICLTPLDYKPGLDADSIDSNDPEVTKNILLRTRLEQKEYLFTPEGSFSETTEKDGNYYAKPVRFVILDQPIFTESGGVVRNFEKGDIIGYVRSLNGAHLYDKSHFNEITPEKLQQLAKDGMVIECDEKGKPVGEPNSAISDALANTLREKSTGRSAN